MKIKKELTLTELLQAANRVSLRASAISKILFSEAAFCSGLSGCDGLCMYGRWLVTNQALSADEYLVFRSLLKKYGEENRFDADDFFWSKGAWEPRKKWLEREVVKAERELFDIHKDLKEVSSILKSVNLNRGL